MKIFISLFTVCIAVYLVGVFFCGHFDPETVRDQRVLITGASSGIGEQLAYQYAKLGARLVITARKAALLSNVAKTCLNLGARHVSFLIAHMDNPRDRSKVIEYVEKDLGGLDVLLLNHAILHQGWWLGNAENLTFLEELHQVNFFSHVDLASKALPMLITSRGRIGVVSSMTAKVGSVLTSIYSSAKFALNSFFSSLRQELRHNKTGVSVTLAILGPVSTDAFVNLTSEIAPHFPKWIMTTPSACAREILDSVAQRHYNLYFDWKSRFLLNVNAMVPEYFEDSLSDAALNDARTWYSRIFMFLLFKIF